MSTHSSGTPLNPMRSRSLATRLTWTAILMVMLAVIAVGSGLIAIADKTQRENAFRLQQQTAEHVSQLISSYMFHATDRLSFFLQHTPLYAHTRDQQRIELENLLITSLPLFNQVSLLDRSGNELHKLSRFYTFLPEELTNRDKSPAYISAVQGQTYIGPVSFLYDTGVLSVKIALPVKAPASIVDGVIIAEVNVSHLWQDVSLIKIGRYGYAYLVDRNGRFVAYQKPAEVLKRYGEDMRKMPPVFEFIKRGQDGTGQVREYTGLLNETVIGVYAPIKGTQWAVMVEQPTREAYASIVKMQRYLVGLMIVCVLLAGGLGFLVSRRLVGPIRTLTAAAQRFGTGDLKTEFADVKRQDEVGVLSRAFKKMQAELLADITARKQTESELRKEKEFTDTALNAQKDTFFLFEPASGKAVRWNRAFTEASGYTDAEIAGRKVPGAYYGKDDLKRAGRFTEEVMQTGSGTIELDLICKNGRKVPTEYRVSVIRDNAGKPQYIISIGRDITERKQAEKEKLALERQVQHAQKLESLGVLAGGIAHDFNNLLMAILANTDLAAAKLPPASPIRKYLLEIEKASERAADLARQMLAYSGKGQFVIKPLNFNVLVRDMANLFEAAASDNITLTYSLADHLPPVDGDMEQIRQVIMNLITNASEAIADSSGIIHLSTGVMHCDRSYLDAVDGVPQGGLDTPLAEGAYAYLEVTDTGCGMDAETTEKIFDPFFTTKFPGRGLGMAAVSGIVRGHKGLIRLSGEKGQGATVRVLFPAKDPIAGGDTAVDRPDAPDAAGWRGSGTVLIADDEESICSVGKQMLEHMGFSVLTAFDGRAALNTYAEHVDDIVCVLLDLTMPRMDGTAVFREIKRIRPDAIVILCSGYSEQDATRNFKNSGLAGFIQKPFNMAELKAAMKNALGHQSA